MRQIGPQRSAVRAAGGRSRQLQDHQRHPRPCRGRRLPAAFHADGADPAAAGRSVGAHRRRRILHHATGFHAARRRDDRAPHRGCVPRGCRRLCRQRGSALGLDRGRAMDAGHRGLAGPADCGRRPRALCRQERRPEPLFGLRPVAAAGARAGNHFPRAAAPPRLLQQLAGLPLDPYGWHPA